MNVLQVIFFDDYHNWDKFQEEHNRKIRPIIKTEVNEFCECGDIRKGYRLFVCEGGHQVKFVPLRCKGKFYPTCATGESRTEVVANDPFALRIDR
ncbi:transposase zinc-binding domain-containing protein [Enterococcus sp. BWT-B8]|nr:transposase zinc-binding domain-containing protein [Enterococcus sp. BWT-B8]MCB5953043.1 transposase zinc-binding domain-containing protein [Enterococcus sp. BWT-B8]